MIQGNMDVFETSFAHHLTAHFYGTPTHSHESYRAFIQQAHQAFAGHSVTIHDLMAEGDNVAVRLSFAVTTHHSSFGKNPPTGQPFQLEGMAFLHFEQGKVVEMWGLYQGGDFDLSPA